MQFYGMNGFLWAILIVTGLRGQDPLGVLLDAKVGTSLRLEVFLSKKAKRPDLSLSFARPEVKSFFLTLKYRDVHFGIRWDSSQLRLVFPNKKRILLGRGEAPASDSLNPPGFAKKLMGRSLSKGGGLFLGLAKAWLASQGGIRIRRVSGKSSFEWEPKGAVVCEVERRLLEKTLFRGLRRGLMLYLPGFAPTPKRLPEKQVGHGRLLWQKGRRVVLLSGSPEEIGRAHGELLAPLILETIDSYVHLVGAVETLRSGRFFPGEMEKALTRLKPHIPLRQRRELRALAKALPKIPQREVWLANILPEYFHCSGFALFGKATKKGVLLHGRVLDYMTAIGLQDAACLFVVQPDDGFAFANVGYAGFVGSVTGMNLAGVSLGEMGGGGRSKWNGVPMASLMRKALETCETLGEVKALFQQGPRTCEYYYVFADAKGPGAVGVAATPEKIEFMGAGVGHPLLGRGIPDVVVLSAGRRLQELRARIEKGYGEFTPQSALRLMDRPVAMQSNLHNALMVPGEGLLYVANANRTRPAAETNYVRYDLKSLAQEAGGLEPRVIRAKGACTPPEGLPEKLSARAREFLPGGRPFRVRVGKPTKRMDCDALVRFPSALQMTGIPNDEVVLEWYRPVPKRDSHEALLTLHILAGQMIVARGFARAARSRGHHAFVLHMPGYGLRRGHGRHRWKADRFALRMRQAVMDVHRARIAIEALRGIHKGRVYLQGTSLGGFVAALAAGSGDGFAGHFLMLAGAGLSGILEKGKRDSAKIRRAFARAGIQGEALIQLLKGIDPEVLAPGIDPEKTWLYSARKDQVVPPAFADLLAKRAGLAREHHLWCPGDHYSAVFSIPIVIKHMLERM
jgi:pimeloyl-ACP methyl ester carboxylesterase